MEASFLTEVLLPLCLAIIMLGMGLTMTLDDFRRVVQFPKAVAIGLVAQIVLLPVLGWLILQAFPMEYGLAVGLMILALNPGGPTSSLITFLARGDAALSVTLTATSSLITLITTPLGLFYVLQWMGTEGQRIDLPLGQTIAFLLGITIIPVTVGMVIKAKKPNFATASETPFKIFGMVFLLLIIAAALRKEWANLPLWFAQVGAATLALNLAALAMGAGLALAFKLNKPQATSIAIDTGNCNGTLSIALAATILKQPAMAIAPAIYSLVMLVIGFGSVFVIPRMGRAIRGTEPLGATSLADVLRKAEAKFGERIAYTAPGRKETRDLTYPELTQEAIRYSTAFRSMGIQRGQRVAILADNCMEWALADWGAQALGIVTVPIFPTSTAEAVQYILEHSESVLVVCGSAEHVKKAEGFATIRLTGPGSLAAKAAELEPMHREAWDAEVDRCQPEELATLIYTSGTTGHPKGVMLPHRVFTHVCDAVRKNLPFDRNEVFLSFLPMSHVYERISGQVMPLAIGARIVFSRGLTSLSTEMAEQRPTVMLCVPRFLEATMDRMLDSAKKLPWLDRKLFEMAYKQGLKKARGQFAPGYLLLDMLVLSNVREKLGGNFRFFVSGGAALAPHVAEFYMAMGLKILQGYGLTETGGATFINRPNRNKYWTVGEPIDMDVKIASDGEILLKGRGLMQGYYKSEEATAAAIDPEGWFHTGDIGEFEGPNLKITDRKKDLFKLSNGKYIAPQPLENKLKQSPLIQEAVIFGEGQDMVTALLVPNWENLYGQHPELANLLEQEMVEDERVRLLIKAEVDQVNQTLPPHEVVKRFRVLPRAFTVEAGELTPSLKVKRRTVGERYESELASMR